MSASPSMAGGNRGLWALRIPLEHLGARVYPDMFSLAQAHQAFDAEGASPMRRCRNGSSKRSIASWISSKRQSNTRLKKQWVEFLGEHPRRQTDRVETAPAA